MKTTEVSESNRGAISRAVYQRLQMPPGNTVKHDEEQIHIARVAMLSYKIGEWVNPDVVKFLPIR